MDDLDDGKMKAPVTYYSKFVEDPDSAFQLLKNNLDWERRDTTPRSEYYCNDFDFPYIYGRGKGQRLYQRRPYHSTILDIRKKLESLTGFTFEVCFLNLYLDQSDSLGWHADDSPEMNDNIPIATVSLGAEREIWFRVNPDPNKKELQSEIEKLKLEHGSMALMAPGMQDTHQHRIPKASFHCGERISLTFRGYVIPKEEI